MAVVACQQDVDFVPVEDVANEEVSTIDRIVLTECMSRLSDQERQIVVLHVVSGFKHREIANMLELNLSTVLSKYHRAIRKLKTFIEKENGS